MDMGEFFQPAKVPSYIVVSEESGRPYYVGHRPRVVELLVPMCCSKCEEKVRESMFEMEGVQGVVLDPSTQRVRVSGFVDPVRTLKKVRKVKRDAQLLSTSGDREPSYSSYSSSRYVQPAASTYPASTYQTSYHRYSPSYHQVQPILRPTYDEMLITNPCYVKHVESRDYWH